MRWPWSDPGDGRQATIERERARERMTLQLNSRLEVVAEQLETVADRVAARVDEMHPSRSDQ